MHQRRRAAAGGDRRAIPPADRRGGLEGYGLTEASPVTHANLPARSRVGSIGLPLPDTRVRVVSLDSDGPDGRDVAPAKPGEMLVSGPQVMSGYFADPEQTAGALSRRRRRRRLAAHRRHRPL